MFDEKTACQAIETRLMNALGDNYDAFKKTLIGDKGIITGSIILQAIYNETWKFSDIDIFVPVTEKNLSKNGYDTATSLFMDKMYPKNKGRTVTSESGYHLLKKCLREVRYYQTQGGMVVNIMHVDLTEDETMEKFIRSSFDFDILKNTYDFTSLNIFDKDGVLSRKTKLSYTTDLKKTLQRYLKYSQYRNITFDIDQKMAIHIVKGYLQK